MKVLTMCQGGNVRSVALKYLLRYKYGHDALACGWESNKDETRDFLFEWADVIIIMQKEFAKYVPEKFHNHADGRRRLFCNDVGVDRFGNPFHPELQKMLDEMVQRHKIFGSGK